MRVLSITGTLPGIVLKGTEWNTPSMQLPVVNGIVDLTTGEFRESQPSDYVRAYCPVEWQGMDVPAPKWNKILHEIFNGDEELVAFVQRFIGYSITGETKEQVFAIWWGEGANGKGTIMYTIQNVLGDDFFLKTQADSLMDCRESYGEAARPFLLAFREKRLVWASESKEGQSLKASFLKELTGDGTITARGLYQNPVTFPLTCKIILSTNHCPQLSSGDDYAMWRRVLRIPFTLRFVENPKQPNERKADKDLLGKLRAEYPGILAWIVCGCIKWQTQGLNPPKFVTDSTEAYQKEEDLISQYIAERLIVGNGNQAPSSALFKDYSQWCSEYGYTAVSGKAFAKRIKKRFGHPEHSRTGSIYRGFGLKVQ